MTKRGRRPGQRNPGSLAWKISRLAPGESFLEETEEPSQLQRHVAVELSRNPMLPRVVCSSYRAIPHRGEARLMLVVRVARPEEGETSG